jgi:hypothetical protein
VENEIIQPQQSVGPIDNTFGTGGYFSYDQRRLYFDVYSPVIIESVLVYAQSGANRTIEVLDNQGNLVVDTTIFIPAGTQRVPLNFYLTPGTDYQIKCNGTVDLYRNNSGPNYPYTINGLISITRSDAGSTPYDYYYFFYDWYVREPSCRSSLVPVSAVAMPEPQIIFDSSIPDTACTNDNPITLSASPSGGAFSGTGVVNGVFDPALAGIGNHTIIYEYNDSYGCDVTDSLIIYVYDCVLSVGERYRNHFSIYPNPVHLPVLNIRGESGTDVEIFDVTGKIVDTQTIPASGRLRLNIENWYEGIYLVKFLRNKRVLSVKKVTVLK